MKKTLVILLAFFSFSSSLFAELKEGYYRVKNAASDRYIYLTDDKGSVEISGANVSHDLDALVLRKGLDYTISDPGSIIYVSKTGGTNEYDLSSQGTGIKKMTNRIVTIAPRGSYYTVGATQAGITKYLGDRYPVDNQYGIVGTDAKAEANLWEAIPLDANTNNYFGLVPSVAANGQNFAPFYAEFGYELASEGMQVYCISKMDERRGIVCLEEISGAIPNNTPVIVGCSSNDASNNKLSLINSSTKLETKNILSGNMFNYSNSFLKEGRIPEAPDGKEAFYVYDVTAHTNQTAYNPETMRVLGLSPEGKLAFVKDPDLKYIPANQSYLVVSKKAPDCLLVVDPSEYEELSKVDLPEEPEEPENPETPEEPEQPEKIGAAKIDPLKDEVYNLLGRKVAVNGKLRPGIYIINGKKTIIR